MTQQQALSDVPIWLFHMIDSLPVHQTSFQLYVSNFPVSGPFPSTYNILQRFGHFGIEVAGPSEERMRGSSKGG